jgi:TonB family protein
MGYQALLFCPDEKIARVISQVFNELDFTVDPVHEPFAAVKQLMAQHYDALVVDCDNEQNASLLFRSARNSSSNQSSLAFAVVEGQTGVAKAYRIGANLVLTKPINVEQAKGTVRVARGLLRKGSDAATSAATMAPAAMAAKATAGSAGNSGNSGSANDGSAGAATGRAGWNNIATSASTETSVPSPMKTTEGHVEEQPKALSGADRSSADHSSAGLSSTDRSSANLSSAATQNRIVSVTQTALETKQAASHVDVEPNAGSDGGSKNEGSKKDAIKNEPEKSGRASLSVQNAGTASGASAAAAPAKQGAASVNEKKTVEEKLLLPSRATSSRATTKTNDPILNSANTTKAPSFGGLSEQGAGGSGRNKKILIAAVVVLALAALAYFANEKFYKFGTTRVPAPQSGSQDSAQPAPAVKPMSSPEILPPTSTSGQVTSIAEPSVPETSNAIPVSKSAATAGDSGESRIAANTPNAAPRSDLDMKKSAPALQVKSHTERRETRDEESAPPSPATLALASANDSNLSSVVSPASLNLSKPPMAALKVSQGVSQGLLIKRVQPQFPQAAIALHAHGAVQIEATINKEGNVINPKILRGDPVLARAAIDAVRQWRYKPYYLDGGPVEIQTQITIDFKAN